MILTMRKPVIIESPFKGWVSLNKAYLQACIRDTLNRGETPYASHQMLTDALDDGNPEERELGISAGLDLRTILLRDKETIVAYYTDLGWSSGMKRALAAHSEATFHHLRQIPTGAWERILHEVLREDGAGFFFAYQRCPISAQDKKHQLLWILRELYPESVTPELSEEIDARLP